MKEQKPSMAGTFSILPGCRIRTSSRASFPLFFGLLPVVRTICPKGGVAGVQGTSVSSITRIWLAKVCHCMWWLALTALPFAVMLSPSHSTILPDSQSSRAEEQSSTRLEGSSLLDPFHSSLLTKWQLWRLLHGVARQGHRFASADWCD